MSIPLGADCDRQKERWTRYRAAAARLYPLADVRNTCHVAENADMTGAFIEMTVWVPRTEIEAPLALQRCPGCDDTSCRDCFNYD